MPQIPYKTFLDNLNNTDSDYLRYFVRVMAMARYAPSAQDFGRSFETTGVLDFSNPMSDAEVKALIEEIDVFFAIHDLLKPVADTREYAVVGFYPDTGQRYAEFFNASSAADAEKQAQTLAAADGAELVVAAVLLNGKVVA
jgi:heme-degrading monooxygenase HmoA